MKTAALFFVFVTIVFYIACCVGSASFSPAKWSEEGRSMGAIFWVIVVLFGTISIFYNEKTDR